MGSARVFVFFAASSSRTYDMPLPLGTRLCCYIVLLVLLNVVVVDISASASPPSNKTQPSTPSDVIEISSMVVTLSRFLPKLSLWYRSKF